MIEEVSIAQVFVNANISSSLKINFKLRGTNHYLEGGIGLKHDNTMIVGADVSHTGKGPNAACPSMAGVVATCCSYMQA